MIWIFTGRTDAKAEAPIFKPPDAKSRLFRKDPDTGKDWRQEKRTTEDEMVGCVIDSMNMSLSKLWEMLKDREAWCGAVHWGHKVLDTTEQLNNDNNNRPIN